LLAKLLKESKKRDSEAVVSETLVDGLEPGNTAVMKKKREHLGLSRLEFKHFENLCAEPVRKLTGWIQWTFTKCALSIYHENGDEVAKLSAETEDSIVSLEFDDVFHKFKIKLTTFGVFHCVK
jgi:hypothetical protein